MASADPDAASTTTASSLASAWKTFFDAAQRATPSPETVWS